MYMLGWIDLIYGLPFSYYHSFVLEEKFGFNKMTIKLWLTDMIKGQGLAIAFGIPIGSAFLSIINKTGQGYDYLPYPDRARVQQARAAQAWKAEGEC
jgi:STE24 endopeptidase